MINPLLQEWDTPYGTPPFDRIEVKHFIPAAGAAIKDAAKEIDAITSNPQPADFENTIATLEKAGDRLDLISAILFNLNSADTNKELQEVVREISPVLTRFSNDITLNEKLFLRVKHVFDSKEDAGLNTEQMMLLEKVYRNFVLGGAGLDDEEKKHFRAVSEELSLLSVKFEENVLEETNAFILHINNQEDLAGLPQGVVEMAAMEARSRELAGWIFTLQFPSYLPFMKYCEKRDLREKMYKAYASRAFHGGVYDNKPLVTRIINLRLELAGILGFSTYAELALSDRMADTTEKVMSFLQTLHEASLPAAKRDVENVKKFAASSGFTGQMERWDWAYFSEKLQKANYDIDDEILKPYFKLENVEKAVFKLATDLYGIEFRIDDRIPVYHPEVKTFDVVDSNGRFLAILYIDYFPRPGKSGGAWMNAYRDQKVESGNDIRPHISIVANFSRPTESKPSLLTFNEVTTLLHEFGHSLHGILTKCTFESLSGTNVARDFVELPSQFMENYAYESEWLSTWAFHYKTGIKIPDEIISKIKALSAFNEGYACNRQLGFAFLDMAWHTVKDPVNEDIASFESDAILKTELFPPVDGTNISSSFTHVFGGGYAAGYYGYKWAEVLDADAFWHFKETGIFNRETAASFRENILEKGGTDKPMKLYVSFRGREPGIDAFLERSGLTPAPDA